MIRDISTILKMACPFANLLVKSKPENPYSDRFKRCNGNLIPVKDCKDDIDGEHGELYIILVRSGFINQYEKWTKQIRETFLICENHRKIFGKGFIRELRQSRCPEHESGKIET